MPIRWDNVNNASLAEASRPLEAAGNSFNAAFAGLQNVLKQRETIDAANWDTTKANNTVAFLDAVSKYRTPEELQAAQQSGALDALRARFGNQIDANAVRGAADSRLSTLQQQARDNILYQHTMQDEKVAPLVQQYKAAVLEGGEAGKAKAAALADQYSKMGGRDLASLVQYADERGWTINERGMKLDKHTMDMNVGQSTIAHQRASEDIQRQQANTQAAQVRQQGDFQNWQMQTATDAAQAAKAASKSAAYRKELVDSGNLYAKEGIWDGSQATDFMDTLTKNKIGDDVGERSAMIERLNKIARDGVEITSEDGRHKMVIHDIPVAAARAAMLGATDQMWNGWNQGYANTMEDNLKEILKSRVKQDGSLTNRMTKDLQTYREMLQNATANPQPLRPVVPTTQVPTTRRR